MIVIFLECENYNHYVFVCVPWSVLRVYEEVCHIGSIGEECVYCSQIAHFWRRQWQPTPVLLPGRSHGWKNLVGCSPWGRWESDTTGRLHFCFLLSCIGEGNGNPLQCFCLENPRDRAWWAAVYGVTQSRTQLKQPQQQQQQQQLTFSCKKLRSSIWKLFHLVIKGFRSLCYQQECPSKCLKS